MPQSLDTRELGLGRDFRLVRLRQLDPSQPIVDPGFGLPARHSSASNPSLDTVAPRRQAIHSVRARR